MARALAQTALAIVCVVCLTENGLTGVAVTHGQTVIGTGSVAAGRAHTLAATPDGRVYAWGAGGRGQIGDGALVDRWTPTLVVGLEDVVSVAAGAAHSIALTKSGEVYAWGANASGRLGDGTKRRRTRPVRVLGLPRVKAVAAGRAHSLALGDNGKVFAWGRNAGGQLGNGKKTASLVPVQVSGLGDIVAIAAGDAYSLAVTRDGHVWAWGSNEFGMLGDGTTKDRLRPVPIALTGVASVAAGEAHTLALLRSGEVYSWGRGAHGELGTGSTRASSTPKRIAGLQATAIAAGRHFSAALRQDGHPVAWGANGSGQLGDGSTARRLQPVPVAGLDAVTILALGDAHAVAVAVDGTVLAWGDGASGRLGNGAIVDQAAPSDVAAADLDWDGEDEAPPDPPTIVPASGIYPAAQSVMLTAARNTDLIRFTLDGSVPTEASSQYTAPFVVPASTTVTARSFSPSGLASSSRVETYTIDTTPPAITVSTSPQLPAAGWLTSPVTVTFHCADNLALASCSVPVIVTEDGRREISGTAVDLAGHRSAATVVVPLDLAPPVLSISSPGDLVKITADRVEVVGTASDAASGVVAARCNGEAAAVLDGAVHCEVSLHPGRNDIVLYANDGAGHNSSAAISVERVGAMNALTLSPATRTMAVSEVARLALLDEYGSPVETAVWTSSDHGVVELSQVDPPELTAVGIGTATITAEKDGITATAAILVSAALEAGAVRWTLPPKEGFTSEQPIFTNRTDADGPAMFTVETQDWGEAMLRAVSADGDVLWQQHSPGVPLLGDSFGGVLAGVFNEDEDFGAYVRLGGGSIRPWRFESAGGMGRPAQAIDGTLYAIEYQPTGMNGSMDKYAVVIDGATGRLISRTRLAREVNEFVSDRDGDILPGLPPIHCMTTHDEWAPETMGPVVGGDGRGYLVVRRHVLLKRGGCIPPFMQRPDRTIDMALDLMILSPNDPPATVTVFSMQCAAPAFTTFPCDLPVRAYQVMPDGLDGVLVTFERATHVIGVNNVHVQRSLTRIDTDGSIVDRPVGPQFSLEFIGQAGTALTFDDGWKAMDLTTGDVRSANLPSAFAPLAVRPDGGVAALDMTTKQLKITDAAGGVESAQPFGLDWFAVPRSGDWVGHRGTELAAVVGPFSDATRFAALKGNAQGQLAVSRPGIGLWLKTHNAFEPLDAYQHASLRVTPINQRWLVDNAQRFEACSPQENCVPLGLDDFGNRYFTVGAGTGSTDTALRCAGFLTKGLNRPNDVRTPPNALVELPIDLLVQGIVISSLLEKFDAYQNNLPYYCFPEDRPGSYNSNSFAHGLLHAAGVGHREAPPTRQSIPGWFVPVPDRFFQR